MSDPSSTSLFSSLVRLLPAEGTGLRMSPGIALKGRGPPFLSCAPLPRCALVHTMQCCIIGKLMRNKLKQLLWTQHAKTLIVTFMQLTTNYTLNWKSQFLITRQQLRTGLGKKVRANFQSVMSKFVIATEREKHQCMRET